MFYLAIVACLQFVSSIRTIQKETALNAQISSQEGATVYRNTNSVAVSGTTYKITVSTQDEYDIRLSLDKSWGFKSLIPSTISLTLDGQTPSPDRDTDILLVFSVNNWQYFSFFMHLDYINNIKSRIYPSVATENITRSVSDWISDVNYLRWERLSNNNQWIPLNYKKQTTWPLQFVITNDPIESKTYFKFYHNQSASSAIQYTFNTALASDEEMDVYIMGDSLTEKFSISSFNIQLLHETITNTLSPTQSTHNPTQNLTHNPTQSPSIAPTLDPFVSPTKTPSTNPTSAPSSSQSATDSISSTFAETIYTSNTKHDIRVLDTSLSTAEVEIDGIYLSAEQRIDTTKMTERQYTTDFIVFPDTASKPPSVWSRMYKWTLVAVAFSIVVILCGCIVKMCCKKQERRKPYLEHAKSHSMMPRVARYSKSCEEGRQTPPSRVDDEINLMDAVNVNEQILEMKEVDGTARSCGENYMLAADEFIINGESMEETHDGVYGNDAENQVLVAHNDGINGEYDEEGNVLEEDNDVEHEQTYNDKEDRTNDGEYLNIGRDEFIVVGDNDDSGCLGDDQTRRNKNDIV